MLEFENKTE